MSIEIAKHLACDASGCNNNFGVEDSYLPRSNASIRAAAKQNGWSRVRLRGINFDFCDEHLAEAKNAKAQPPQTHVRRVPRRNFPQGQEGRSKESEDPMTNGPQELRDVLDGLEQMVTDAGRKGAQKGGVYLPIAAMYEAINKIRALASPPVSTEAPGNAAKDADPVFVSECLQAFKMRKSAVGEQGDRA